MSKDTLVESGNFHLSEGQDQNPIIDSPGPSLEGKNMVTICRPPRTKKKLCILGCPATITSHRMLLKYLCGTGGYPSMSVIQMFPIQY